MEDSVHQLSFQLINTLNSSLSSYHAQNPVLGDLSLQIMMHIISCASALRDILESSKTASNADAATHLYLPFVNGILATLGKLIMESFTFEPKAAEAKPYSTSYNLILRHTLRLFPEMTVKKHKNTGKVLLHHVVFKAKPAIAVDAVKLILAVSPSSGTVADSSGALALHWATKNPDLPVEVVDILLAAHPQAMQAVDTKGFLPLHWAVNIDNPNIDIIRRLLKLHPKGASSGSTSGSLPLHYAVSRAAPSAAVIKALMAVFPDGIRYRCQEGCLPIHRYLQRPKVDQEVLVQLVRFFPDGLLVANVHKQTPLHIALDQAEVDDATVSTLLKECPIACSIQDGDGYYPLHMILDHPLPNYMLAEDILSYAPAAATAATNDQMLPLHLVLSINNNPSVPFLISLLRAYPRALDREVQDIVPAMGGEALADAESWSGEWVERAWRPIDRARERGFNDVVLFLEEIHSDMGLLNSKYANVNYHASRAPKGSPMVFPSPSETLRSPQKFKVPGAPTPVPVVAAAPAKFTFSAQSSPASSPVPSPAPVVQPVPAVHVSPHVHAHLHPHGHATSSIDSVDLAVREVSEILPFDEQAYSPATHTPGPMDSRDKGDGVMVGNYMSSSQQSMGMVDTSPMAAAAAPAPANARAPPSGPIPTSLLQAAEHNAMRLSRAQYDFLKGKKTKKKKTQRIDEDAGNSGNERDGPVIISGSNNSQEVAPQRASTVPDEPPAPTLAPAVAQDDLNSVMSSSKSKKPSPNPQNFIKRGTVKTSNGSGNNSVDNRSNGTNVAVIAAPSPTNYTAEIMKGLGKVKVHPAGGRSGHDLAEAV